MIGSQPIKVLLVQDDRLMFEGLISLLSDYSDLNVIGVASTAADALEKSIVLKPDLVLMDRIADSDGAQLCERIRASRPDAAVLFLTADDSNTSIEHAVQAGAAGYLSTSVSANELLEAIRKLADGEMLVTAATVARLLREGPTWEPAASPGAGAELTAPEKDVLARISRGQANHESAGDLGVPPAVVRGHVRAALTKLGVHSKIGRAHV